MVIRLDAEQPPVVAPQISGPRLGVALRCSAGAFGSALATNIGRIALGFIAHPQSTSVLLCVFHGVLTYRPVESGKDGFQIAEGTH